MKAAGELTGFYSWLADNWNSDIHKMSVRRFFITSDPRSLQGREWLASPKNTLVDLFCYVYKSYEYMCLCSMPAVS